MLHSAHFCARWQQFVQVSTPSRGVFSIAQPSGLCCIEDQFDTVSQTAGSFGYYCPNRFEDFQHMFNAYFLRRKIAYVLERISSQSVLQLLGMLGILDRKSVV